MATELNELEDTSRVITPQKEVQTDDDEQQKLV